jgi:hypothetical protein
VRRALVVSIALAAALIAARGTGAGAAACAYPSVYPGDSAPKETLAAWMAGGAAAAGLPGELPVMAALVDSGLSNLPQGDGATAGYFQMRVDVWNAGDYAGFPDHPTLQLQWFIDQAQAVRQRRIAAGHADYGSDPASWGDWVADVLRPAEQYRGRYQLRLDDARALIAAGCAAPLPSEPAPAPAHPGGVPAPDAQLIPDSLLPRLVVQTRRYQEAGRSGRLAIDARCSNESCLIRTSATIAIPGRGLARVSARPMQLARGERRTFRLTLRPRTRGLVAAALRKRDCPLAAVRVVAANAGGYRSSMSRTVTLAPSARACS